LVIPYDYLVLATGSKPFVPPIPGTTLHGVFVFRTLDDCRHIAEYAKNCKTAVVIGCNSTRPAGRCSARRSRRWASRP
jgi:nitrite reductase (NADH) large subunit